MSVGVNSGLRHAPEWTQHRRKVAAADSAFPTATIKKAHGMAAEPYEDIFADVVMTTPDGTTSLTVELLIWSEAAQRFQPFSTPIKVTALATSKMVKFNVGGARFFLHVTGTFGTAVVDIYCAGLNPVQVQSA